MTIVHALGGIQSGEKRLGLFEIDQGGFFTHIAAVQQRVQTKAAHAAVRAVLDQREQLFNVRMHVAVRQQADEMHGRPLDHVVPDRSGKEFFAFDRRIHQFGALRKDPAGADGVVTHLAVAHIFIRGQAHGGSMGAQLRLERAGQKPVQHRRVSQINGVAVVVFADADAIHNNQQQGAFTAVESGQFV